MNISSAWKVKLISTTFLIVLTLMMAFTGCDTEGVGSVLETTQEVCPDTLILVNTAHLSSSLGSNYKPIGDARIFDTDTAELFVSFDVYEDICCSTVIIQWVYDEEVIDFWQSYSTMPSYVVFSSPEGGFTEGDYAVVMYIGIREVMRVPFSIV